MDNPQSLGEGINPPRTGEFDLSQLLQYPNGQVRALAQHLRENLGWTTRDSFTGEYISHLYNYVERRADGSYDCSRIQPGAGEGGDSFLANLHYQQGRGPAPHRIVYIESRGAFARRVGAAAQRVDGTYLVGFQRIPVGGGITCISTGTQDRRGRWHFTPATCHTW